MFEDITLESTLAQLKSLLPASISTLEGSWYDAELRAVALAHVARVRAMAAMLPIAFPDETAGPYIDQRARDYGITRHEGTRATVTLTLTCSQSNGMTLPAGTVFQSASGLGYATDIDATVADNAITVTATALDVGSAYNQPEGAIIRLRSAASVTITAISSSVAAGGTDGETDAALYARLRTRLSQKITGESVYDYYDWAMGVSGVVAAKIIPRWAGRGTVQVLILGEDGAPGTTALLNQVAAAIEQQRPVGSDVTVSAPNQVTINVSATVTIGSTPIETVTSQFTAALRDYLQGLIDRRYAASAVTGTPSAAMADYNVVYTMIAGLLPEAGAADYSALTVNSGTANITLDYDEIPALGTVTLTAAEG